MSDRKVLLTVALLAAASLAGGFFLAERALRSSQEREQRRSAGAASAFGAAAARGALQSALDSLARVAAGERGRVGIAVRDVRYGVNVLAGSHDTTSAYPMMSVYKVPIAVAVLANDAEGKLALEDTVDFRAEDVRPFHSPLSQAHPSGGVRLTVDSLLALAVNSSDNAASDRLLALLGGADSVNARLRKLNLEGIRVDRSERELAFDMLGVSRDEREGIRTLAQWDSLINAVQDDRAAASLDEFVNDERDTAQPIKAAEMFARMATGTLLPPPHTERLLQLLRNPNSPPRLRTGIPGDWRVWSKSGTSTSAGGRVGAFNDVALVELPGGRFVSIALFVAGSDAERSVLEDVARAVAEAVVDNHVNRE